MNEEDFIKFVHQTRRIGGLLTSVIDKELADMKIEDLTAPHYFVLSMVAREKSILFKHAFEYTKKLGLKSNGHLVYITTTDYIVKKPSEKKKSSYLIELSEKGKIIVNEIYLRVMNHINKWIEDQYDGDDFSFKRIAFGKTFEQYMDNSFIMESALNDLLNY